MKEGSEDYSHLATQLIQRGFELKTFRENVLDLEAAFMALTKGLGRKHLKRNGPWWRSMGDACADYGKLEHGQPASTESGTDVEPRTICGLLPGRVWDCLWEGSPCSGGGWLTRHGVLEFHGGSYRRSCAGSRLPAVQRRLRCGTHRLGSHGRRSDAAVRTNNSMYGSTSDGVCSSSQPTCGLVCVPGTGAKTRLTTPLNGKPNT